MARNAVVEGILFETDAAELIVARDAVGTAYLAMRVEQAGNVGRFLCTPISAHRLAYLRHGHIDLRDIFENSESGEMFTADHSATNGEALTLKPVNRVLQRWLPDRGFPLVDFLPDTTDEDLALQALAQREKTPVGSFELHPPEAYEVPLINSYRLSEGIVRFQNLIKFAYKKSMARLDKTTKELLGSEDGFMIQIRPEFSVGSFRVHFQTQPAGGDLLGETAIARALTKVDEITSHINNHAQSLTILKENQGPVVTAYKSLLNFVVVEKTPVVFKWTTPGAQIPPHRSAIGVDSAKALYDVLSSRKDLGASSVTFQGTFTELRKSGGRRWALITSDGKKKVSGFLAEGADDVLKGIVYETKVYRVACEERLDESGAGFGKQDVKLFMTEAPTPV